MNDFLRSLEQWAAAWQANLWRASWQGGLAILAAWAIIQCWKSLSPRVTCWIWRVVCLKLLVTLLWVEPLAIPILPASTPQGMPAVSHVDRVASRALDDAATLSSPRPPRGLTFGPGLTPHIEPPHPIATSTVLALLWTGCVATLVAFTIATWLSVRRLCRSAASVASDILLRICRDEAERLAIHRLPGIRLSPRVESPLLIGIWRPTIVLPDRAEESFDETELRLMFGHEFAHLTRGDLLWNWLPTVVGWLFFFHPLVWLLKRCWLQAQEAACDELLIQNQIARPAEYGRLLLKLATRRPAELRAGLAAAGVLGAYRNLERRILAMTRVKSYSSRRLIAAAIALSLIVALGIVPWRLVAQELKADKNVSVQNKLAEPDSIGRGVWLGEQTKSSPPTIVIAEHVLLWDNQIVNWDQVLKSFRAMRTAGPFRAIFSFTNVVARRENEGWRYWNDRIMAVYPELFSPVGVTVGSMSPRGSQKFDAIRAAEDLSPNPARARTGDVLTPDGKQAAGAQVVVLPIVDSPTVMLSGAQLRYPLDEQWILTDAAGRFTVHPDKDEFWIAALHPSGFSLQRGPAKGEHRTTRLQPWATVKLASTGEVAGQTASLTANPMGDRGGFPQFEITSLKTKGGPIEVKVPSGFIVVGRSLDMKQGVAICTTVKSLSLAPGEQRTITVPPATDAERSAADKEYERTEEQAKTARRRPSGEQSDAKPPTPSKSGQDGKPKSDETPSPEAEVKQSAASGKESPAEPKESAREMQREQERRVAPFLAAMAKEHGYKLDEKQNLRHIAPLFPAIRIEWYNAMNPSSERVMPNDASTLVFHWSHGQLGQWMMSFGQTDKPGDSLSGLLDWLARIKSPMVEGPDKLLRQRIPGDWVVREGASDEQVVKEFNDILRRELSLPVRLTFRDVERPVYVIEGVYHHKPVPGGRDTQSFISSTDRKFTADVVEVFSKQLFPDNDGRVGSFSEFVNWLREFVDTPVVSDVKEPPRGELCWYMHTRSPFTKEMEAEDHDSALVLANITAQTGLSFRKETRRVRILFVSRD